MNATTPTPDRTDVRTALKQGIQLLRTAHVPSDSLAAEVLLIHATSKNRTWLYTHPEETLAPEVTANYFALVHRRAQGEPTQHLTGKQEFWGLEFEVTPEVLIPRPETEHLIEVALDHLAVRELRAGHPQLFTGQGLRILDVGTGSGNIAIALAKDLPGAEIFATDISSAALKIARRNAARHSFANRIHFLESNLLDAFSDARSSQGASDLGDQHHSPRISHHPSPFDLIISNPPYIGRREAPTLAREVRDHEPHAALFGGEEGYEIYGPLILQAAAHLKPGSLLILELGHDSLAAVQPLLETPTWTNIAITNDLAGIPRVLSAERL
jgi:release factor glutamine methyltransferase